MNQLFTTARAILANITTIAERKESRAIGSRATIDTAEVLMRDDPLPQTCFRGAVKIGSPVMVIVGLRFKDQNRTSLRANSSATL